MFFSFHNSYKKNLPNRVLQQTIKNDENSYLLVNTTNCYQPLQKHILLACFNKILAITSRILYTNDKFVTFFKIKKKKVYQRAVDNNCQALIELMNVIAQSQGHTYRT